MNYLGFDLYSAIVAALTVLFMGIFLGFIIGLIRYILFGFMEGKLPNWQRGGEIKL